MICCLRNIIYQYWLFIYFQCWKQLCSLTVLWKPQYSFKCQNNIYLKQKTFVSLMSLRHILFLSKVNFVMIVLIFILSYFLNICVICTQHTVINKHTEPSIVNEFMFTLSIRRNHRFWFICCQKVSQQVTFKLSKTFSDLWKSLNVRIIIRRETIPVILISDIRLFGSYTTSQWWPPNALGKAYSESVEVDVMDIGEFM